MTNADLTQIAVAVEDDDTWVCIGDTALEVLDVSAKYLDINFSMLVSPENLLYNLFQNE
jgi:hypothetical protein